MIRPIVHKLALCAVLTLTGVSMTPGTANARLVILACIDNTTGAFRKVEAPNACTANETLTFWNRRGPQGPQGDTGDTGPAGPEGPQGPAGASAVGQFVGFSTVTVTGDGDDGVNGPRSFVGMNAACQADFGPSSRLCTSKEFVLSPTAAIPSTNAWVHPDNYVQSLDFTGGKATSACRDAIDNDNSNWTSAESLRDGMTVAVNGSVLAGGSLCDVFRPVTCCSMQ